MEVKDILTYCDHTLLAQDATWEQIKGIVDDGIKYNTASVCIPASFVKQAADYAKGGVAICTVIGFPNGYSTTASKVFEAADAVANGADEVDMVVNIGWMKDGKFDEVRDEIAQIKKACGDHILKVIFETCLLTKEEIVKLCELCVEAGADFVKTSTGFSSGGATEHDVRLMRKTVGDACKVKAAGGIHTAEEALAMVEAGADRIGTSSGIAIAEGIRR